VQNTGTLQSTSSSPSREFGIWPALGGGLLALGLAFVFVAQTVGSVLELESPLLSVTSYVGTAALISAFAILAVLGVRVLGKSGGHAAVR